MPFTYEFPRPAVTADAVLFAMRSRDLAVLLVKRARAPEKGKWALPGGFVEPNESLDRAVARELHEETGVTGIAFDQLGAFGEPGRDPRGHTITVVFYSFLVAGAPLLKAGDDAREAAWHPLRALDLPSRVKRGGKPLVPLAFDHGAILEHARARLAERLVDPALRSSFELVPPRFTLTELQRVYEAVLGCALAPRSFRAKLAARGIVEPVLDASAKRGRERLYRFRAWSL